MLVPVVSVSIGTLPNSMAHCSVSIPFGLVVAIPIPPAQGRAGGACTSALLQVLYNNGVAAGELSWVQCLRQMRTALNGMGFDQVPQLTSSRLIDVNTPMAIVPPTATGRKRAVLIGINYTGQQGQLSGCHNDVKNIIKFLTKVHGFNETEMLILMDDGQHHSPTKKNIEDAFTRITQYSQAGDVVFVHYSGHVSPWRSVSLENCWTLVLSHSMDLCAAFWVWVR